MHVPAVIARHTTIHNEKLWHFYMLLAGWASINTVMNVSVVLFLSESLGGVFLAGLALSLGSVCAMFFDGLFSALQRIFVARTLFLTSIVGMMIAVLLFLTSIHPAIAFLAAVFFRISFDLYDITAMSYILQRSKTSEYGQNLSYKQLSQGIGMIIGLVLSAVLLAAAYFIGDTANAVAETITDATLDYFFSSLFLLKIFLVLLLILLFLVAYILFDREAEKITTSALAAAAKQLRAECAQKYAHFREKLFHPFSAKKEEEGTKRAMSTKEVFAELLGAMRDMLRVLTARPRQLSLLWALGIMGIFSYWDTFLATFLPIFFTEVLRAQEGWLQHVPGSLLLLLFILPVLGFLPIVAKMGDKYGRPRFMLAGIFITAIATIVAGATNIQHFGTLLLAGFAIAFGYLFGMSSGKAEAAQKLNIFLSGKNITPFEKNNIFRQEMENNAEDIDTNASAGPLMLVDNVGNIIGPAFGGLMIDVMGFQGFFLFFGFLLLFLFLWSVWKWKTLR